MKIYQINPKTGRITSSEVKSNNCLVIVASTPPVTHLSRAEKRGATVCSMIKEGEEHLIAMDLGAIIELPQNGQRVVWDGEILKTLLK